MIKADDSANVKATIQRTIVAMNAFFTVISLFLAVNTCLFIQTSLAQDAGTIKEIEADEFSSKILKESRSKRVILVEDSSYSYPKPGKILLLKNGEKEVAAVRVLKTYQTGGKFAAKIIYPVSPVSVGSSYRTLTKIGDKLMRRIREREKRLADPTRAKTDEELSSQVGSDDHELDRGIKGPDEPEAVKKKTEGEPEPLFKDGEEIKGSNPKQSKEPEDVATQEQLEVLDEDDLYLDPLASEAITVLEPYPYAFTAQYGSIHNVDSAGNDTVYSATGLRVAYNFSRFLLFEKKSIQDMLSLELSTFFYSISGFQTPTDNVSMLPFIGTIRYNLLTGEYLNFFAYGGFMKNIVTSSEGNPNTTLLDKTVPVLGGGAMLRIGPAWAVRVDYGLDLFGVGVVLKF